MNTQNESLLGKYVKVNTINKHGVIDFIFDYDFVTGVQGIKSYHIVLNDFYTYVAYEHEFTVLY